MNAKSGNIFLILIATIAVVGIAAGGYFFWQRQQTVTPPLTWDECLKVPGATTLMTYPGQCVTPDGRRVTQPLSEEEKKRLQPPENIVCGTIAGNLPEHQCPSGYKCQLERNYPDAAGKCVKNSGETTNWKTYKGRTVDGISFSYKYPTGFPNSDNPQFCLSQTENSSQGSQSRCASWDIIGKNDSQDAAIKGKVIYLGNQKAIQSIDLKPQSGMAGLISTTVFVDNLGQPILGFVAYEGVSTDSVDTINSLSHLVNQILSTFQFLDKSVVNCLKDSDCPQGFKCSANCDVNAPGGADCSIIEPPPTCIKSSP